MKMKTQQPKTYGHCKTSAKEFIAAHRKGLPQEIRKKVK